MLESGGFRVVSAASADEALEVLGAGLNIKAVVTDVELSPSGMNGFELARRVHQEYQISAVVMSGGVSPKPDDLPASAYFLAKPVHRSTLVQLVQSVVKPQPARAVNRDQASSGPGLNPEASHTLTPRQHEVLGLLVQGKSNREIAEAMGLSENTVKVHLVTIFKVLGVHSRTEALLAGLKRLAVK
jgi:DNA-binding NarL/FixJ family response regulator